LEGNGNAKKSSGKKKKWHAKDKRKMKNEYKEGERDSYVLGSSREITR
jgi:hypothetical protein